MLRQSEPSHAQDGARVRTGSSSPIWALAVCLICLFVISLLFIVPYRQWEFSAAFVYESVSMRFHQLYGFITGSSDGMAVTVYQYVAVILAGAALACCGAVFQGSFRNVLAGPSTMGVMSGGTLGYMIYLLLFTSSDTLYSYTVADLDAWANRSLFDIYAPQIFVLIGGFLSVLLVLSVATAAGRGRLSAQAMILSGMVLSGMTGMVSRLIRYYFIVSDPSDPRIEAIRDITMGNFNNITSARTLLLMAIPIVICCAAMLLVRNRMNALSLSEDEAISIGVNIRAWRYTLIIVGTVLTATVIAFCGHIGFVGFMVPLVARRLVGPNMAKLLPVSLLVGPIMLIVVFDIAYVAGLSDYLNVITSSIGSVVLLVSLLAKRGV